jgi:hypothetical protein
MVLFRGGGVDKAENIDSWKYSMLRLEGRCSIQLSYEQTGKAAS